MRKIRRVDHQDGFSLIELLVAVMILAGSLVLILQLFSGGLKAGALSENYGRALLHARSKMEEIRIQTRLAPIRIESEIDDLFAVEAIIERLQSDESEGRVLDPDPLELFDITVSVYWQERVRKKKVEISTLALARSVKPPE